jgi:hypothetical protein
MLEKQRRMLEVPVNFDDFAEHADASGLGDQRLEVRILRTKLDAPAAPVEPFDGGFVSDQDDDDLAGLGRGLAANQDDVAVQDSCALHRVPAYVQGKQLFLGAA